MFTLIAHNWRLYVLRGCLAVVFGLMALAWPRVTVGVLVILFGVYAFLEGALAVAGSLRQPRQRYWWVLFLEGVAGVGIGLIAFVWPGITAVVLLIFIAVWAIFTGVLEIAAAVELRRRMTGEWVLIVAGALSILIGILLIANPGAGMVALVWLIGVYALIFGFLIAYIGLKVRKVQGAQGE